MDRKPIVLILCTGNSCRSQIAEGFLRKYQSNDFDVHSAGTDPKDEVHPLAIKVMQEIGVDISGQSPKAIEGYLGHAPVTHLLIVCDKANSTGPRIWPGTLSRTFMPFEDPAEASGTQEEILSVFRRVRDQISKAMKDWKPAQGDQTFKIQNVSA